MACAFTTRTGRREALNNGRSDYRVGGIVGACMTEKEKKLEKRLDELHDEQDEIMTGIDRLTKEWFASRKEQEVILKKLGWW